MKKESKNKKGFTLIEMLVVVLIIGILAAIALPQYQLTIDKATFAKLQATVASLRDAYDEYYMIHGVATRKFENLSFTMPNDFIKVMSDNMINCVQNKDMFCCMSDSGSSHSGLINCGKNDSSIIYVESFFGKNYETVQHVGRCLALINNKRANRLCSSLGTKGSVGNTWTPNDDLSYSYQNYYLK